SAHWPAASRLAPAIPKSRPVAPWSYTVPVGPTEGYMLSATSSLPQRSLHNGIEHAEKPGAVILGYRSWSAGTRSELPQVPRNLTTDKCVTDIRLRPLFARRGDDPRPLIEPARCQRDIGSDAYVGRRDVLDNPVVGRVCAIADQDHSDG